MINRIITALSVSCLLLAISAQAAESSREIVDVASLGPQVGESVPDFRLQDQFGNYHTLDSIMGPNGAMLLFHRSADW